MSKESRESELWRELDKLAFWLSAITLTLLTIAYFLVASFLDPLLLLRNFLLAIITNLIPIFLIFALSYAFLRRIQFIRSERDNETLSQKIASAVYLLLQSDLQDNQQNVINTVASIKSDIASSSSSLSERRSSKIKILFIAANPKNTVPLRLTDEVRRIKESFRSSKFGASFEIVQELGVRKSDLQVYLLEHKPDILHFSGHSARGGIYLEDTEGNPSVVSETEFCKLVSVFRDNLHLVFLNGDSGFGQKLAEEIDYVVANSGILGDEDAIEFASAFYHGLGNNVDIETAYELGCARLADSKTKYDLFKPKKEGRRKFLPTAQI